MLALLGTGLVLVTAATAYCGIGSAYLAAAAALGLCRAFDAPAGFTAELVTYTYAVYVLLVGGSEFASTSSDAAVVLGQEPNCPAEPALFTAARWRCWVFVAALVLPIGTPSGYIVGPVAVVGALGLVVGVRKRPVRTVVGVVLAGLVLGLAWWWSARTTNASVLGLIAGLFVPTLLIPDRARSAEATPTFPNPVTVGLAAVFNWITPGLTTGSITATLIGPSVYRPVVNSCLSAAFEGWGIQLIAQHQISTKTALGDLYLNVLEPTPTVVGGCIALGIACFWLPHGRVCLPNSQLIAVGSLVTQSVIAAGALNTVVFLVAGLVAHLTLLRLAPGESDTRALCFLVPTLL